MPVQMIDRLRRMAPVVMNIQWKLRIQRELQELDRVIWSILHIF